MALSKSQLLTIKYENEIMEVLKPLFREDVTKEDISFYTNMVGIRLVELKSEQSEIIMEMYK